jgi:serine/threonine protein kinase
VPSNKDRSEQGGVRQAAEIAAAAAPLTASARASLDPTPELPSVGDAPYELRESLGNSVYGRAYRAWHTLQQREVGLHFVQVGRDLEGMLPLAVAKCAQLTHRHVIALEESGRSESGPYLVTQPLEGVALSDYLADGQVLAQSRALVLSMQIGRALRAAHKHGIVHGALTPSCVRLVRGEPHESAGERARVIGFGAALFAPQGRVQAQPGEQPYFAPEFAQGVVPGPRGDVYALGALLFRMLTGEAWSPGAESVERALTRLAREAIPPELSKVVSDCLQTDADVRPPDVVSVMRRLRELARKLHADELTDSLVFTMPPSLGSMPANDVSGRLPERRSKQRGWFRGSASGRRASTAGWIMAGLLLALAAAWLLWDASTRGRSQGQTSRRTAVRSR